MMTRNAVLLLIMTWGGVVMIDADVIPPYLGQAGGLLAIYLLSLVGFVVFVLLERGTESSARRQFWLALGVVTVIVVGLFSRQLALRGSAPMPRGIHDGAVQTEVAAGFLRQGHDPYGADYRQTPYAALNPPIPGGPAINVVWSHYIYPPFGFMLTAALQALAKPFGVQIDVRLLYLAALVALSALVVRLGQTWAKRTEFLLLTAGNPFIWLYVLVGYNDVLMVAAIVAAAVAAAGGRWGWSGLAMGAALAVKQSAWVVGLVWIIFLAVRARQDGRGALRRGLLAVVLTTLVIVGPFVWWHPVALFDDVIRYASGSIPYSYPISGSTILQYLHVLGLVPSAWSLVPAHLFQLVVGLPLLWWSWALLRREPTAARWLTCAAITLLAVLMTGRYMNNNYTGAVIALAVGAYALHGHERSHRAT